MVKKTLLSLAIAATAAGMVGCNISSVQGNNKVDQTAVNSGLPGAKPAVVAPIFSAASAQLPINIDILFADAGDSDGTANVGEPDSPATAAINRLAGFSTTAPFYLPFNAALDPSTVGAGSSVHIIKLLNAEDDTDIDPLKLGPDEVPGGDSILENSPVVAGQPNPIDLDAATLPDFDAEYVQLTDGTHAIRIQPNKPLEPRTKYIVAITDTVKGAGGESTVPSAEYIAVSGNGDLASPALNPVRTAIQGWEQIAGGYLTQATSGAATQDNVILSYAFTTSSDSSELMNYAAPSLFLQGALSQADAEAATDAAFNGTLPDGTPPLSNVVARSMALAMGGNLMPGYADLAGVPDATIDLVKANPAYAVTLYGQIAGAPQEAAGGQSINTAARAPQARTVTMINGAMVDGAIQQNTGLTTGASPQTFAVLAALADLPSDADQATQGAAIAAAQAAVTDTDTRYLQGMITLPNFLSLANEGDGAEDDPIWGANTTVGAMLSTADRTLPPTDIDGSTNVTWRFPFAQPVADNNVPVMVTLPGATDADGNACTAPFPVVMYVHGITGNRGNGLTYTGQLADRCIASVAIDHPVHGVAPDSPALALSVDVANATKTLSPWAGVLAQLALNDDTTFANLAERHGNLTQNSDAAQTRIAMVYDDPATTDVNEAVGSSGSTFINLQNLTRNGDNQKQAVADLLNLNASLGNIDTAVDAGTNLFNLDRVYVAGHSLGGIIASTYVTVNNDPSVLANNSNLNKIQGLILSNSGAHITKLLENSPSFGPQIIGGLASAEGGTGPRQGSSDFESFLFVAQSALDPIDPANNSARLAATDTPVLLFNMVGDGATVLPDGTVPNFDYFGDDDITNPYTAALPTINMNPVLQALGIEIVADVPTASAPLAGTNPKAALMNLETVNAATDMTTLATPVRAQVRFSQGDHGTFATAEPLNVFGEMVGQSVLFVNGAYNTGLNMPNTTILESN